jgi:ribosomal protein S12 methylthiotransferase accessory factor YcaO
MEAVAASTDRLLGTVVALAQRQERVGQRAQSLVDARRHEPEIECVRELYPFHVPTGEERERMLKNRRAWGLRTSVHLKSDFY